MDNPKNLEVEYELIKPNIMNNPKNQKQLVIYYLYNYESITMKFVIDDSLFYKFNTRLSEMEKKLGYEITHKDPVKFISRFGHKSRFKKYSNRVSDKKLIELFDSYK
jgi:hypothetical protein